MTIDLVTSARVESDWARALRVGHTRHGSTPIYDQLLAEHQVATTPLSSRRRIDAGTPRTVFRQPGRVAASARSSSSTRPAGSTAGQGSTTRSGGAR